MNASAAERVAVIGAGPCGLAACKVLGQYGLPYECLESSDTIGGIWNVERGGGGYRSLYANTSIKMMRYSDFPFPEGSEEYPTAASMLGYFNAYVEHNDLRRHIHFNRAVQRIESLPQGHWRVHLDGGEQREYRAVLLATGQYARPRLPHDRVPGSFSGVHLAVQDYMDPRTPLDLTGKRVLVVGLGTSAAEVAAELSRTASDNGSPTRVTMAARSGRWVVPRTFGSAGAGRAPPHPADPLPGPLKFMPDWARTALMRRVMGGMIRREFEALGGAAGLGVPEPSRQPWEERPTLSTDLVAALQDGLIDVRPGIERFDGKRVTFSDGSTADYDAIIYATGYERDFPYLAPDVLDGDHKDIALYQRLMPARHDTLFVLGCLPVMCALWPLAEQQSHWVARLLLGRFRLPAETRRRREAVQLRTSPPVMCNAYVAQLRRQAGGF